VNPSDADELEQMRRQLRVFADDLRHIVGQERRRREESELAFRELQQAYQDMVRTLAVSAEMKDAYTSGHLDRTYQFALALTQRVAPELTSDPTLGYGYLLHDVGKILIPDSILNKPGPLNDEEWEIMASHPLRGFELVKPLRLLGEASMVIRSHHERWDGRGYPDGLKGENIYLPARIFTISDTFDAMTTDRPYRKAMSIDDALHEIDRHAGTQFDPELAREFLALCEERRPTATEELAFVR
jgi:ribonuclease P protein subunit RPR2